MADTTAQKKAEAEAHKSAEAEAPTAKAEKKAANDPQARYRNPSNPDVDVRLDDRTGTYRPPLEEFPAVPQQVDGPDVEHQAEHTAKHMAKLAEGDDGDDVERKGAKSLGPHGLGDDESE
jgi:hypothetical protein